MVDVQFRGCVELVQPSWITVKHEYQGFVVEVGHFRLKMRDVQNPVAVR